MQKYLFLSNNLSEVTIICYTIKKLESLCKFTLFFHFTFFPLRNVLAVIKQYLKYSSRNRGF